VYGVPENLNLTRFEDLTLTMIGLGEFQVQFHFHPEGIISVEGEWSLVDGSGDVIDRAVPNPERGEFRLHRILGQAVTAWQVDPPRSFSLVFGNGHRLRVFDSSTEYESFSIQPGDIFV
jgi:hypothetical protein